MISRHSKTLRVMKKAMKPNALIKMNRKRNLQKERRVLPNLTRITIFIFKSKFKNLRKIKNKKLVKKFKTPMNF